MAFGEVLREFGVKVSLAFDSKKFEAAETQVEKFGGKLRGFALEVSGMAAGLFALGNAGTSYARGLKNQSDLLGVSTDDLQDYAYAAKIAADVNKDDFVASLQTLGDTMDKARSMDPAAIKSLQQLGGAAGDTNLIIGRLSDSSYKVTDAFADMSKGVSKIATNDPLAASRLTEMTLGNAKLFNLLKQGPKALADLTAEGHKNARVSENMINMGNKLDIQLSKIFAIFRKFGIEIGIVTMQKLMPMINQFTKWFAKNKDVIASGIIEFVRSLASGLQLVFTAVTSMITALSPLVDMLGGSKSAVQDLVAAFLTFKALQLSLYFAEAGVAIAKFIFTLGGGLETLVAVKDALMLLKAVQMGTFFADMAVVAGGLAAALAPVALTIAGIAAAIGVAVLAFHDIKALMNGDKTWTGQGWDKLKAGAGWLGQNMGMAGQNSESIGPYGQVASAGAGAGFVGPPAPPQENHFNTTMNIAVPTGTTAAAAASMTSTATVQAHEQLMTKAKLNSSRRRVQ